LAVTLEPEPVTPAGYLLITKSGERLFTMQLRCRSK